MRRILVIAAAMAVGSSSVLAVNVLLGKNVILNGTYGTLRAGSPWSPGTLASSSTLTDGLFLAEGSIWQTDTIWWDSVAPGAGGNYIEIDLAGRYRLDDFTLQADNNDNYQIYYLDDTNNWVAYGYFPPSGAAGMRTRSGTLGPIETTRLAIQAFGGDGCYSVSEFQANGQSVPEPFTMGLAGMAALAAARRKLRARRA